MRRIKPHPSNQILREILKTTAAMDHQSKAKFLKNLVSELWKLVEQKAEK